VATHLGARFWQLWSTSGLSNLADGVFKTALPLIAVTLTRDPVLVAGVSTAGALPWLVLALPAGAMADRHDRRRLMLRANAVRATALAVTSFLLVTGTSSIWLLYAVALVAGTAEVVHDTAGQSMVPLVVERDLLARANGRMFAVELAANEFVGPPLGGVLVGVGAALATATPAGLWVIAIGALHLVRGRFRVERVGQSRVSTDIAEGVRFVASHPVLRTLSVMTGAFNLASSAVGAVLVLRAVGPGSAVGLDSTQFGLLLTATAVGSVVGTFLVAPVEQRLGSLPTMALGLVMGAVFILAPALSTQVVVVGALFAVGGAGTMLWNVPAVTLRQRLTPGELLGRVIGAQRLVAWGTRPLGAILGGLLAERVGLAPVFWSMGALVLLTLPMLRKIARD
jgi:MFS family permease